MKLVSQLDADGYYVGPAIAQRSPLEPGVFLIPGGAVDAAPPVVPQGGRARWSDGWVFEDIPAPESDPAPTLDQIRADKIAQIDRARDTALEDGFLFGGVRYDCDDLSVQRITGAAVLGIAGRLDWVQAPTWLEQPWVSGSAVSGDRHAADFDGEFVAVGAFAGFADGHDDAAPIGVFAGYRRFDQWRIGDGKRDTFGRRIMLSAGNMHGNEFGSAFPVSHDGAEVCGYLIEAGGFSTAVFTDLGVAEPHLHEPLSRADLLVIESNHDEQMLLNAERPWHLKQRIMGRQSGEIEQILGFRGRAALIHRDGAAGVEHAARGRTQRRGHVTREDDALALALELRVRNRHRREQRLRVRVLRRLEDALRRPGLDDARRAGGDERGTDATPDEGASYDGLNAIDHGRSPYDASVTPA